MVHLEMDSCVILTLTAKLCAALSDVPVTNSQLIKAVMAALFPIKLFWKKHWISKCLNFSGHIMQMA